MKLSPFAFIVGLGLCVSRAISFPAHPGTPSDSTGSNHTISPALFESLEELSRLVDISYCVGTSGIRKPFSCLSRCAEFEGFELISTWNTGPLLSDSCGYIALSHPPWRKRIIVAFRGTYSIANTVVDLSTVPQEYVPYPGDEPDDSYHPNENHHTSQHPLSPTQLDEVHGAGSGDECLNCTVHSGFWTSWHNTRKEILPHLFNAKMKYPDYQMTVVGHSLGGAVAALASLEFQARGWNPQVTTFGEPRIGNKPLMQYIDNHFNMSDQEAREGTYRRVTHVNDPVPLLPLEEWGYKMHGGEVFISKADLSPTISDLHHCRGDEDPTCIAGEGPQELSASASALGNETTSKIQEYRDWFETTRHWGIDIPPRYKLWELFFAHRDYFWRLGLCVPGGDPKDWYREYPHHGDGDGGES